MGSNRIFRNFVVLLVIAGANVDAFHSLSDSGFEMARATRFQRNMRIRNTLQPQSHRQPSSSHTNSRSLKRQPCLSQESICTSFLPMSNDQWDGDDIRWTSRMRRNFSRRRLMVDTSAMSPAKTALIAFLVLLYGYQILTTVLSCYRKFPSYWTTHAPEIILDSIWGSAIVGGPLTSAFGFSAVFSSARHSYRYITSGLFHNSLPHLLVDIGVLARQPSWLATGLGGPLYLTCFWVSTATGNIAHLLNTSDRRFDPNLYFGSNGGICGLYGLLFVCLSRMARANPGRTGTGGASGQLARGIAVMIALAMGMDNVSKAANVGGFLGGAMVGILFGPRYSKSYSMRRKNSVGYDPASQSYRRAMGFGIMPSETGRIPLKWLYGILLMLAIAVPSYRNIPFEIAKGLLGAMR